MRAAFLLLPLVAAQDVTYCTKAPQSGWDLCNSLLDIDVRAADAVSRLTLADKFKALDTNIPPLNSINLPAYK